VPSADYLLKVVLALYVPYTLISPFIGVFIDRFQRRKVVSWTNVMAGAVVVVVAGAFILPLGKATSEGDVTATIALIAPVPGDARSRDLIQYDLGQATMSIMVAAADLGIGSAHSAVSDQELARRLLGFPEDRFCAWLITLGVPADRPLRPIARPNRLPFEDVVHRGHW